MAQEPLFPSAPTSTEDAHNNLPRFMLKMNSCVRLSWYASAARRVDVGVGASERRAHHRVRRGLSYDGRLRVIPRGVHLSQSTGEYHPAC